MKELITIPNIEAVFTAKGYPIFKGKYNMTVGAVRRKINPQPNVFDDYLFLMFDDKDGKRQLLIYEATTEPGRYWGSRPISAAANIGSAIIKEGFYQGAYTWGVHGAGNYRHQALIQTSPITIYRDSTWDGAPDVDKPGVKMTETTGLYGCNIHASAVLSNSSYKKVDNWSAGCLVHASGKGYQEWASILQKAVNSQGAKFSLFLINENDLASVLGENTPAPVRTKKGSIGIPAAKESGDEPT